MTVAVMVATLLALGTASPAAAAPATTVTTGTQVATAGGAVVAPAGTGLSVSIDATGGYDGAGVLSFVACGNADSGGTPVSTPICFDGDDAGTVKFITPGATVEGLAVALAPAGNLAFTYTLLGTGMSGGDGSCIAAGTIPCQVRVVGVDNATDQNTLFQETISWCLPGGVDGDNDGIPTLCDPGEQPPPPPPGDAVFDADRSCAVRAPYPTAGYGDVAGTAWFARGVNWAKHHGVTFGIGGNRFGPALIADRLEFALMLHRMGCSPAPGSSPFSDTTVTAAQWTGSAGVVNGVGPGIFGGDRELTRAELFVMLWRAAGRTAPSGPSSFDDAPLSAWFGAAAAWAEQAGITNGLAPGTFGPDAKVSRAVVVTVLERFDRYLASLPSPR